MEKKLFYNYDGHLFYKVLENGCFGLMRDEFWVLPCIYRQIQHFDGYHLVLVDNDCKFHITDLNITTLPGSEGFIFSTTDQNNIALICGEDRLYGLYDLYKKEIVVEPIFEQITIIAPWVFIVFTEGRANLWLYLSNTMYPLPKVDEFTNYLKKL